MELFIFQIAVFAIIFLSSIFGREALNKTVLVVSVFTLIAVFMTWLIILHFITIVISYSLAITNINREQEIAERKFANSQNHSESSSLNNRGCFSPLKLIMIAICIHFAYCVWSSKNNMGKNIETEKVEELKNDYRLTIDKVFIATPNYYEENYEYINDTTESDIHSDESEYKEQIVHEKWDSYNDWGDSDEYIHGGSVKYGNFKLIENRRCSLDNGKLYMKKRDANRIDFAMEVGNIID